MREEDLESGTRRWLAETGAPPRCDPAAAGRPVRRGDRRAGDWPAARRRQRGPGGRGGLRRGWQSAVRAGTCRRRARRGRRPRSPRRCWPGRPALPAGPGGRRPGMRGRRRDVPRTARRDPPVDEERLLAAAREAVASGLLVPAGDGYAFSHGLIRQVLYEHLLPGERRRLHRSLADALQRERASAPGAWPSTGTWQAARTAPRRRPSPPPARRSRRAPTRRPSGTTRWPSSWVLAARAGAGAARRGGTGRELGRGSGTRRRMGGGRAGPVRGGRPDRPGPAAGAARPVPVGGRRPARRR